MSEDLEIRKTKDGRIFGIKNIRQEFKDDKAILKADISGDLQAANKYLEDLLHRNMFLNNFNFDDPKQSQEMVGK